jgi:hypothetical protein
MLYVADLASSTNPMLIQDLLLRLAQRYLVDPLKSWPAGFTTTKRLAITPSCPILRSTVGLNTTVVLVLLQRIYVITVKAISSLSSYSLKKTILCILARLATHRTTGIKSDGSFLKARGGTATTVE